MVIHSQLLTRDLPVPLASVIRIDLRLDYFPVHLLVLLSERAERRLAKEKEVKRREDLPGGQTVKFATKGRVVFGRSLARQERANSEKSGAG
jgi:hypothetical protein